MSLLAPQGPHQLAASLRVPDTLNPNGVTIRMMGTWENPLFCLADSCRVLGDVRPDNAARRLDDDEKQYLNIVTTSGTQRVLFVTEAGFYSVVMTSRAENAKAFRKWVTGKVLPSIRKHGVYPPPATAPAVQARPWEQRLRATILDHHRYIKFNIGFAHWSVYTAVQIEVLLFEDELSRHGLPLKPGDLPDGSIGQRWPKVRKDKPWAKQVHKAPLVMPHILVGGEPLVVEPYVYHPFELQHFHHWLNTVYFPEHLPEYLGNKFPVNKFGLAALSAADQLNVNVIGHPAHLSDHHRRQLRASGGIVRCRPNVRQVKGSGGGDP